MNRSELTRAFKTSLVVSVIATMGVVAGCIDGQIDELTQDVDSRLPPVGDPPTLRPPVPGDENLADAPRVLIYKDFNAWRGENRDELTLQAPPFNYVRGVDYDVRTMSQLAAGVPAETDVVIITSNSFGLASTAEAQRSAESQDALDEFLRRCGTLVLHAAAPDILPENLGFIAPGMTGPRVKAHKSNTVQLTSSAAAHPFVRGPDSQLDTADDVTNTNNQFVGTCCAHNGSLTDVLPSNANVLLTGGEGRPIYAEYTYESGRVIVGTMPFEIGFEGFAGFTNRLLTNHFWNAIGERDDDCDGVTGSLDCDDENPDLGAVLFADGFDEESAFFQAPPQRDSDPWVYDAGAITATGASQQVLLGQEQVWGDVAVFATLSANGTLGGCCNEGETNRWRAGLLIRAELDPDQDEGFHGYRCALASNAETVNGIPHSGPSTGHFLQLAEFMDAPEDDINSECEGGDNTTFVQLARTDHEILDLAAGDRAYMSFYAIGESLYCTVTDGTETVSAQAHDASFSSGTVGLSTLNMLGAYDSITVCDAKNQQ